MENCINRKCNKIYIRTLLCLLIFTILGIDAQYYKCYVSSTDKSHTPPCFFIIFPYKHAFMQIVGGLFQDPIYINGKYNIINDTLHFIPLTIVESSEDESKSYNVDTCTPSILSIEFKGIQEDCGDLTIITDETILLYDMYNDTTLNNAERELIDRLWCNRVRKYKYKPLDDD